jgi:uroporphyrinogen decarboxylase
MDGAILFSDILVVPDVLGRNLRFAEGEGPVLDPLTGPADVAKLSMPKDTGKYDSVAESVTAIAEGLKAEGFNHTALLGFAGAPFTIAAYMIEGHGSRDFTAARLFGLLYPEAFNDLLDLIVHTTADYLSRQIAAGAEAVQIFDSWAGILDAQCFADWVIAPTRKLIGLIRQGHPDKPIIGFPRKAGPHYADYARLTGVNALGVDEQLTPSQLAELQKICPVQGNLDPHRLLAGGDLMLENAGAILAAASGKPHIFNLGHGVIKGTDPDHVAQLVSFVRSYGKA